MKKKVFFLISLTVLLAIASRASTFSVQGDGGADRSCANPAKGDNSGHFPTLIDDISIYKPLDNPDMGSGVNTQSAVGMTVRVGGKATLLVVERLRCG